MDFQYTAGGYCSGIVFFGSTLLRRMKRGVRSEIYLRIFIGLTAVFTVVCLVRPAALMKPCRRLPGYISLQDIPEDMDAGMKWPI